ncbi:MAG TPA: dockerin type I domain-containing protein [Dehalococcoidia bacterium]|nr:dockerin type I domain-containing protein [Dehalococcoidia bacterium]
MALALVLASLPGPAAAQAPPLTLSLCRAAVQPCQREVNLLPGQTVALDLVLTGASPLPVIAWETHLKLSNGLAVEVAPAGGSADPVQEQGDALLALDGLNKLAGQANQASAQYFTVQNRYLAESGQLDYTVALLRPGSALPEPRVAPLSDSGGLLLGRITIRGVAQGVVDIVPAVSGVPFRVVGLTPSGEMVSQEAISFASPLARINVDPLRAPVSLLGQVALPAPSGAGALTPRVLAISFWEPGAAPPWHGGSALPVAVFDGIPVGQPGAFQVTDIVPEVLPPGVYDVRIKVSGGLSQLAPGFALPPLAGSPALPLSFGPPRFGDVNGDGIVDAADLGALRGSFGRLSAEPGYSVLADFNADHVVDGQDFSMLALSFGQPGE